MNIGSFSKFIDLLLTDKADVYHYVSAVAGDGTTANTLSTTPAFTAIPCRISFIRLEAPDSLGDSVKIRLVPKLFFQVSTDIVEGDYVVVTRLLPNGQSVVYQGHLALPSIFESHMEVLLDIRGDA